jgi:hypothetical protein
MFSHYSTDGQPLFIVIPKNPEHKGQKFQLHFCNGEFMDETDEYRRFRNMDLNDYGKVFAKYDNCAKNQLDFHSFDTIKGVVKNILEYIHEHKDKIINSSGKHLKTETYEDIKGLLAWDLDTLTNTVVTNLSELHDNDSDVPYIVQEIPTMVADASNSNGGRLWNFIYDSFDIEVNDINDIEVHPNFMDADFDS